MKVCARTGIFWPLVLGLLLSSCGGESYDSIRNLRSPGRTIICFGDSLTEGVGAGPGEDYPSVLARHLGVPIFNAGRRGDTTAGALERLANDVFDRDPRLVIVLLGGNDFLRRIPLAETRKNLEEIVRQIQAQGAIVVLAGLRLGLFTDEYSPMFQGIARQFGAFYVPQLLQGILSDAKLKSDTIHPNGAGYGLIAERLAGKIKPLLKEADRRRSRAVPG